MRVPSKMVGCYDQEHIGGVHLVCSSMTDQFTVFLLEIHIQMVQTIGLLWWLRLQADTTEF